MKALAVILSVVMIIGMSQVAVTRAQEPSPTPGPLTPVVPTPGGTGDICGTPQYAGGQTINVLNLRIVLPTAGDFTANFGVSNPGGQFVRVCFVQGNSAVVFNLEGKETNRIVNSSSAAEMLDQVVRSVQVVPSTAIPATAQPSTATPAAPTPTTSGPISPPSTGNAGLR
jgi:hypothetical protein